MKNSVKLLAVVILSAGFVQSSEGSNETQRTYRLPAYGMAGCGLGTLVFDNSRNRSDKGSQLVQAGLNDIGFVVGFFQSVLQNPGFALAPGTLISGPTSGYQSSSITTGTSNCDDSPASAEERRMERETYVAVNFNDLSKESAQGKGDRLQSLAEILGCGDERSFPTFAQVTQTHHAEIFSDSEPANVTARILTKAQANSDLRSCLRAK